MVASKIPAHLTRQLFAAVLLIATISTALLFAQYMLATLFNTYDDEGYLLLSLVHYVRGGSLYRDTYSQYGPFYFCLQATLFSILRLQINHDTGRFVTLLYWITSALLAGRFVCRISHSIVLGAAAIICSTFLAAVLANEPGHPQQVVLLLLAAASCLSLPGGFGLSSRGLLALGAIGAALLLTKINVGVFYIAALGQTLLCLLPSGWFRTAGLRLSLAYAVAAPLLLMHADLKGWARGYCLLAICCTTGTFVCGSLLKSGCRLAVPSLWYTFIGVFFGAAFTVTKTSLDGVSIRALIEGVILDPLKHPRVFSLPLIVGTRRLLIALFIAGSIGAACLFRGRLGAYARWLDTVRFTFGIAAIVLLLYSPVYVVWLMPFLPLSLIPIADESWELSERFPRLFIANLAATQFLQAYPVAGSQISIGAVPMLLWAFVCIADGLGGVHGLLDEASRVLVNALPKYALSGTFLIITVLFMMFLSGFRLLGYAYPSSGLRGSNSLHLPPEQASRYRFLASATNANCGVLFSLPGMGSFNFWSDVPAPNGWNLTAWVRAFDTANQDEIPRDPEIEPTSLRYI